MLGKVVPGLEYVVVLHPRSRSGPAIDLRYQDKELQQMVPDTTVDIIDGLDHLAPDDKAPEVVARRVLGFL